MGLRYLGQVLNLKDFKGTITVQKNTFSNNYIKYGTCDEGDLISSVIDSSTKHYAYGSRKYA